VIDLHCHALPGIDDGPATMQEAIALARAQVESGVTTVIATPHVSWTYPEISAALIAERTAELNAALQDAQVPVTVLTGAEVALTRAMELPDEELRALGLGGGPWLLVEPPFGPGGVGIENAYSSLMHRGFRIVIAHPERAAGFLSDRALLERLVGAGALTSLTAASLTGGFGRTAKAFATALIRDDLGHNVASDAHAAGGSRGPGMAEQVQAAGYGELAEWLCREIPQALLDDAPLPDRPEVAPPARGLARLFRRA
jgi:protein-tyrosine phosphatase